MYDKYLTGSYGAIKYFSDAKGLLTCFIISSLDTFKILANNSAVLSLSFIWLGIKTREVVVMLSASTTPFRSNIFPRFASIGIERVHPEGRR